MLNNENWFKFQRIHELNRIFFGITKSVCSVKSTPQSKVINNIWHEAFIPLYICIKHKTSLVLFHSPTFLVIRLILYTISRIIQNPSGILSNWLNIEVNYFIFHGNPRIFRLHDKWFMCQSCDCHWSFLYSFAHFFFC